MIKKVLLVGNSGFPLGLAESQKQRIIAKSLKQNNIDSWIINRSGSFSKIDNSKIRRIGRNSGVPYLYCYPKINKAENRLLRNIQKVLGFFYELYFFSRLEPTIVIASTKSFFDIVFYKCFAKLFKYKFLITWVEISSSMRTRKGIYFKINDYLFENYSFRLIDGILPISEYLINILNQKASPLPLLKMPALVDFNLFDIKKEKIATTKYFLFCGSPKYIEIIDFLINSFNLIKNTDYYLYLLLGDNKEDIEKIRNIIGRSNKKDLIVIFGYMPYEKLTELFVNSQAQLIPLRPTTRDIARFPNKVAEYLASGNPIISTNFGEIKYYLKDGITGLIAENYDIKEFSEKMKLVIEQPEFVMKIGQNGKDLGKVHFDYLTFGKKLIAFINNLYQQK